MRVDWKPSADGGRIENDVGEIGHLQPKLRVTGSGEGIVQPMSDVDDPHDAALRWMDLVDEIHCIMQGYRRDSDLLP
jgi:hypothetical protein